MSSDSSMPPLPWTSGRLVRHTVTSLMILEKQYSVSSSENSSWMLQKVRDRIENRHTISSPWGNSSGSGCSVDTRFWLAVATAWLKLTVISFRLLTNARTSVESSGGMELIGGLSECSVPSHSVGYRSVFHIAHRGLYVATNGFTRFRRTSDFSAPA